MSTFNTLYVNTLTNDVINGNILRLKNITVENNTISSTNIDGNINILPNGSGEVILNANPTVDFAAATKQYVDDAVTGLTFKAPVTVAPVAAAPVAAASVATIAQVAPVA